jgi:uncharacterized protein YacL
LIQDILILADLQMIIKLMKDYPARELWLNFISVAAGVLASVIIVLIFQWIGGHIPRELAISDPVEYWQLSEHLKPKQVHAEIIGLIIGVLAGSFIAGIISTRKTLVHALLVPVILLMLVSAGFWQFTLQKEVIWLVLPFWMTIALTGFYSSRVIKIRFSKEPDGANQPLN